MLQIRGIPSEIRCIKGQTIREWNIISAGPSSEHVRKEHLIPNAPVIAINSAIRWVGQVLISHWAVMDDPNKLGIWDMWGSNYHPMIEVWAHINFISKWKGHGVLPEPLLPRAIETCLECGTAKVYDSEMAILRLDHGCYEEHGSKVITRSIPTLFAAIERAKDWHGGRVFRCFGVDMEGMDNTDPKSDRAKDVKNRWAYERWIWANMMNASKEDGLTFERVQMVPDNQKSRPINGITLD